MDRPLQSPNVQQRQSQVVLKIASQLVRQRPWTCWGGLCAATVAVSGVALFGLFSPFFTPPAELELKNSGTASSSQVSPQTSSGVENSNVLTTGASNSRVPVDLSQDEQPVPAWILGAIALGLSTSSLVLWYRLQPYLQPIFDRYRQQQQKRLKRYAHRYAIAKRQAAAKRRPRAIRQPIPQRRPTQLATNARYAPVVVPAIARQPSQRSAPTSFLLSEPRKPQVVRPVSPPPVPAAARATAPVMTSEPKVVPEPKVPSEPKVTVVPAEENHPLDWRHRKGLADALDLRKQHSLSAVLRGRASLELPMENSLRPRRLSMPLET